jgi:kanamycin kinase
VSVPVDPLEIPAVVVELAAGRVLRSVWRNELGGLTFQLGEGIDREFVKWCPPHPEFDLELEAIKLDWAGRFVRVPSVIAFDGDDDGSWLHTQGLPGRSAVDPYWLARPRQAARAIGSGLRMMHDRLPVRDCPWSWSLADRLARIRKPEDRSLIAEAPAIDRLVVCHGDACAPNTVLLDDGTVSGHVDLGMLGVADRWADLAIASYSLAWNYGGQWEAELFDAYGIDPDPDRISFYRRLWDAT